MRRFLPPLLALAFLLAPPAQAATELKLATWNIAWLTSKPAGHPDLPRGQPTRRPEDFAALRRTAERLDADVIALQEVDGPLAAARVLDSREYEFHFPDETDTQRAGFAWRRGLRVTRNPDLVGLDLHPQSRRSLRRGADITVHLPGGERLRLLSVHLDAGCAFGPLREPNSSDCQNLARQSAVLAGWIAERRREGVPFMILGDFNRRLDERRERGEMMEILTEAAPLARPTEGARNSCWGGRRWQFIDHILAGGGAKAWLVPSSLRVTTYDASSGRDAEQRLSDHCPVSVTLRIP